MNRNQTPSTVDLTERQAMVLRALVKTYVDQAGPVASRALARRIPVSLSPASIRNTLAELHEAGLIDKAHASAGRVPTPLGMSVFIDRLLDLANLGPQQQRIIDRALDGVDAAETPRQTSHVLSEQTRQLGFVMAPRFEHLRMRTVHFVPVAEGRILAILVAEHGGVLQRVFDYPDRLTSRELEQAAAQLASRLAGRTLTDLRRRLERERESLRGQANQWMRRVCSLGLEACDHEPGDDLVITSRSAVLDQPEFSDPERIRGLFAALETNQNLLALLRELAQADRGTAGAGQMETGWRVNLGSALDEPSLRDCALVAMPYGSLPTADLRRTSGSRPIGLADESQAQVRAVHPATRSESGEASGRAEAEEDGAAEDGTLSLGVLGVIGPQRMDYGRVIPLVSYCAEIVTRKLLA